MYGDSDKEVNVEAEVLNHRVEIVEVPTLSDDYIQFRDKVWIEKAEEWDKAGKEIFNGALYRFMGIENDIINLGLMTYADRLVRSYISVTEIEKRFGKDHVMKNCVVNLIPITTDGKILIGRKAKAVDLSQGKLAYIGGNINEDEVQVKSFEDIYSMMIKETEEESNIPVERAKMSFLKLEISDGWASFYFKYLLDFHSEEIGKYFKEGEFVEFVAMTPEELKKTDRLGIGDFEASKEWIDRVI